METEYLREYIVFAESLNYTIAAKKLFISQPTLSAHMSALEKTIGVNLLKKSAGKVYLTPAGKHLLGEAYNIVNSIDQIIGDCRSIDASSLQLNVGPDANVYIDIVNKACKYYSESYPDQTISFNIVSTPYGREEALKNGIIDFDIGAIISCPEVEEPIEVLYPNTTEQYFLQQTAPTSIWMTNENKLYAKEIIDLDDFDGATFLLESNEYSYVYGRQLVKLFAQHGIEINVINQKFSSITEYFMTDIGNAFGVCRQASTYIPIFREENALRRAFTIENFSFHMSIYTAYHEARLSIKKLEFIDALKHVAQENIDGEINA